MRLALTALVLVLAASTADAQVFGRSRQQYSPPSNCPNGVCPAPNYSGIPNGSNALVMPSKPATGEFELWLENGQLVYKPVPKVMEAAAPIPPPKFAANPEAASDRHGRLFYRVVKDRVFGQLVDRGVPRDKARKLVDTLSNESVDVYAAHVQIKEGIGDGKILDWIIDHKDQILALVKLIVSLLAVI